MITNPPPKPSWRKPAGMGLVLLLISGLAAFILLISDGISTLPGAIQALFYLFAGIVWILPLKPLLRWMETGKWRE